MILLLEKSQHKVLRLAACEEQTHFYSYFFDV